MVAEVRGDYPNESAALRAVAQKLGIGSAETLRNWVKREEIDSGQRPGTTTEESAQIKAMKKEIVELKRANDILKAAALDLLVFLLVPRCQGLRGAAKNTSMPVSALSRL
ncbi:MULTISPECIES: transposase [unclassified Streptomyces]|uniref:transposase n=1 Tax=unclassified Streptomyces TaxID=2593676 RepID=UPI000F46ECD5